MAKKRRKLKKQFVKLIRVFVLIILFVVLCEVISSFVTKKTFKLVEIHENDNINNVIANIKKRNVKVIEKLLFIPLKNLLFPKFFSINFTGILRIKAMAIPHIKGFSIPKNL